MLKKKKSNIKNKKQQTTTLSIDTWMDCDVMSVSLRLKEMCNIAHGVNQYPSRYT